MPVLKYSSKCGMCDQEAEYECGICHKHVCQTHVRYGRLYGHKISSKNGYYCVPCWRIERNTILKCKTQKIEIFNGLKKLGIVPGDTLLVQSSVSSFGSIEDNAETLIDMLILAVGSKKGTISMPSFTTHTKKFHPRSSRTDKECGVLSELFRKRKNVTRSDNPEISFTAYGKNAIFIVNNAIKYERIDELSPVQRIMKKNGKMLMLGSELNNCLAFVLGETVVKQDSISCGKKYEIIESDLKQLESYKEILIGQALCRIFLIEEAVELVKKILKEQPAILNCGNILCKKCSSAQKINKFLGMNRFSGKL